MNLPKGDEELINSQKNLILVEYPFLDDSTTHDVRQKINEWNIADKENHFNNPEQIRQAFRAIIFAKLHEAGLDFSSEILDSTMCVLEKESREIGQNLFSNEERIRKIIKDIATLPDSSEEINETLESLRGEIDTKKIMVKLARLVIYMRYEKELRSSKTSEGDKVVAKIEPNVIDFLSDYRGKEFELIYPWLRELIGIMPKTEVFGIDISEVRDKIATYHEDRSSKSPFANVAGEIREQIHRRLSVKAVDAIDELLEFLHSDKKSAIVAGSFCSASNEEKSAESKSKHFGSLQEIKTQLKLIWNNPFTTASAEEKEEFSRGVISRIKALVPDALKREIEHKQNGKLFIESLKKDIVALENQDLSDMHIGLTRYHLKNAVQEMMQPSSDNCKQRGKFVSNLIVLDCILENLALIYYSNLVNCDLAEVNDGNYEEAIKALIELALCTRASGQGTKALGRFSLIIRDRLNEGIVSSKKGKEHLAVAEMNDELSSYIYKLREFLIGLIKASEKFRSKEEIERTAVRILNGMVREKTTLLFGNLLNIVRSYFGSTDKETAGQLERARYRQDDALKGKELSLNEMVFSFGSDISVETQSAHMSWFMGGKGASLAETSRLILEGKLFDIDVPKGFGLGTQTWPQVKNSPDGENELRNMLDQQVCELETRIGKKLGDPKNPLLLVARSGAVISMPGILSTIAHIGLNKEVVKDWSANLAEPERAYHCYIRFLFNYAESVLKISQDDILNEFGATHVADLCRTVAEGESTVLRLEEIIKNLSGEEIPNDPKEQLFRSVTAVFESYETEEVQRQASLKHIPPKYQTGCLVQECLPVLSTGDCSGVFFTRDPRTGGKYQIEYVPQFGEDLVGGRIKPKNRTDFMAEYPVQNEILKAAAGVYESRYWHPNDIEFAIRNGRVNIVQTRQLLLSPTAKVVSNFRFYEKKVISADELLRRTRRIVNQPLTTTYLDEHGTEKYFPFAKGEPISGGVVCGRIISDQEHLKAYPDEDIIFITKSNVPGSITTRSRITGYISEEGGVTSHAALVSTGKFSCIVGVEWEKSNGNIIINNTTLEEGDFVTLDANEGLLYQGELPTRTSQVSDPKFIKAKKEILKIAEQKGAEFVLK